MPEHGNARTPAGASGATVVLLPQHAALIAASGISTEVAEARGYRTVTKKSELRDLGFGESQARVPALVIPIYNVVGAVALYQVRPDVPRIKDGKALKYETPLKARMALDVPPAARAALGNPNVPLFITEGVRKADSAVSRGLCCVALLGVWNWRGTNGDDGRVALGDWESVALNDRQVYIVFDSDVMLKPEVHGALARLKEFLESRGANVATVYLPAGDGGSKVGLDDFFAAGHGVDEMLKFASPTLRAMPNDSKRGSAPLLGGGPPEQPKDLKKLRAAAAPALRHPRALEMFEESCRKMGLTGSLALATTIYLAATTRLLSRRKRLQAHTFVLGPPSSGKSFEVDAALWHLASEDVVDYDGCSPRALIYDNRDIRHRVLVYSEMDSLPLGGDDDAANTALSYLRTLVVDGAASYDVVVKAEGGFVTRRYMKEGPTTLLVTGTKRIPDEQLASRLHEVEVTVDRERLTSVIAAQGRLFQGGESQAPDADIIALQKYLQALAPIDVTIPFADVLGRAILDKAKLTDARLTREFPRIAGFTAAHAILSMLRRDRAADGSIIAALEDYEAARAVIRELSTVREFSKFSIEVWEAANRIFKETGKPVTVRQISKVMLKEHNYVRKTVNTLLQGGALLDARERPSRTAPHLVAPSGESPCRIILPSADELSAMIPASDLPPKRAQVETTQGDNFGTEAAGLVTEANSLNCKELATLSQEGEGGKGQGSATSPAVTKPPDDDDLIIHISGVGDRPDAQLVLTVDDGAPMLTKRPGSYE